MAYTLDSDSATNNALNLTQQSSDPATPAASHWKLYTKSGGLYLIKSDGTVTGPFISSASSGAMTQAGITTLGAGAASITISGIAGTANHLFCIAVLRGDNASVNVQCGIRLNADTTANYDAEGSYANGTTNTAWEDNASTSINILYAAAASAPSGAAGVLQFWIPMYAATTFQKGLTGTFFEQQGTATGNHISGRFGGTWKSTSAVTSVTVLPLSGNWIAGSTLAVYEVT